MYVPNRDVGMPSPRSDREAGSGTGSAAREGTAPQRKASAPRHAAMDPVFMQPPPLLQRRDDAVFADENEDRDILAACLLLRADKDMRARLDHAPVSEQHPVDRRVAWYFHIRFVIVAGPPLDREDADLDVVDPAVRDDALRCQVTLLSSQGH